jgi:hypothetical protein
MFKRTILALAVAALALPAAAIAQENATLILKSGERVSGQLLDHGGVGFTVRVNGQERRIPTNDVAVVDFAGGAMSDADWQKVTGGQHVIWLRNGQTVTGQFYDIGGTTPLRITVKTDGGQREFSSSEISRIALAPMNSSAVATSGSGAPEGAGIAVPGNQQWTATGMTVRKGDVLRFTSTGEVQFTPDQNDSASAAGSKAQKHVGGAPLPQNFAGALIARVGNGEPFPIGGPTATVTMPANGQLFLGINDDKVDDNQGGFRVVVQRSSRR